MRNLKYMALIALSAVLFVGCSAKDSAEETGAQMDMQSSAEETGVQMDVQSSSETTEESEQNNEEQVANPWRDCTEEEALSACPRLFKAPDGAKNAVWSIMESAKDEEANTGELIQLDFTLDGMNFCARAQYGADEDAEIHGLNYDWASALSVTLSGWGEGNMKGTCKRAVDDQGYVDLITWYDVEIGIAYSLSVSAGDLDGFDIQAIAEQMLSAKTAAELVD